MSEIISKLIVLIVVLCLAVIAAFIVTLLSPSENYYLPLVADGEVLITIEKGNWTATIYGGNPQSFSSGNYTEVIEWAIKKTMPPTTIPAPLGGHPFIEGNWTVIQK